MRYLSLGWNSGWRAEEFAHSLLTIIITRLLSNADAEVAVFRIKKIPY